MATKKARPRKRSQRKAPPPPKFVALTAAAVAVGGGSVSTVLLYALDESGQIWAHDPDMRGTWSALGADRKPLIDDEDA